MVPFRFPAVLRGSLHGQPMSSLPKKETASLAHRPERFPRVPKDFYAVARSVGHQSLDFRLGGQDSWTSGGGRGGGGASFRHYRVALSSLSGRFRHSRSQNISRHSACAGDIFSHEASVDEGRV